MSAPKRKRLPLILAIVTAIALVCGGTWWWINKQRWEKTDNAFVQADMVSVSPRIGGSVVEVLVKDNQYVEAGTVLVRLDDADARAALAEAEANLAAVLASVGNVDAQTAQQQAAIAARSAAVDRARSQAELAQKELNRYGQLASQGWVSGQRLDTERAAAQNARAGVEEARAALTAEQRTLAVLNSARAQSSATVDQARAAVEKARLALERTEIRAPVAGVVGARGVRVGQVVAAGTQLMSVVPLRDVYVVANFKETQLERMRLGQTVSIQADAYPSVKFTGRIESFAPATGAEFALIPVENASGNFTKITQRVPVRIALDRVEGIELRPGLSVHAKVDLKSEGRTAPRQ
ncbi:HlyD family secretion protein [uncultured Brevundimonas sp.]|uniref:HlyD family secretion protein n=1 Tax=uncultured Brevundimonas sp. TaxID=213418 RepID=UPI00261045AE|nr:HlyD family secretion protein [uncultured Brevundimonas sp.]